METTWFAKRPVSDVRPGDHAWLAYSGAEERDRVIGAFIREGLDNNEKVVYVTDTPAEGLPGMRARTSPDLDAFVESRQLRVIPREQACLDAGGRFVPEKMLETLAHEAGQTFGQGFRAVRLTTDHTWVMNAPGRADLAEMLGCEHRFGDTVSPSTMAMAICQVARRACRDDELAALRDTHEVLVEINPEYDDGILKIVRTFDPHGLRVEGELDDVRHAAFADRLGALVRSHHRIHLDLSRLGFIDLGGLRLLARHAAARGGDRTLVLDDLAPAVENIIEAVGWHRLPGIVPGRRRGRPEHAGGRARGTRGEGRCR
ncbi:MEDS domain-containing protein [Actinomadura vinacea]